MRKLPLEQGFAPTLYKEATDCQILKKSNLNHIDKMRTILMLNSESNNNNKWLSRIMLQQAETHNILAPEQYGSRKNHDAITAVLNKRLTFDILRLQK